MRRRSGFTLVELLVVIGIIAVLISLLLPTLSRAREGAAKTACASNMAQVGAGILMYLNENKGLFPRPPLALANPADALWWQPARIAEVGLNGLGPYFKLTPTGLNILRCPSDEVAEQRQESGKYPFTFTFNSNMNGDGPNSVKKIGQVRNPSDKLLLFEENGVSINDGNAVMWAKSAEWASVGMLGLRHDRVFRVYYPDASTASGITNGEGKGNVLLADGHVEYVPRKWAHAKSHVLPDPGAFGAEPEIKP